jgi:Fe2+ transport system protein FeoA
MAQVDQPLVLKDVRTEPDMQTRLASMGLHPGVELKIISRSMYGPCIIVVKDCRLVLDWHTAHQILVG